MFFITFPAMDSSLVPLAKTPVRLGLLVHSQVQV